MDKKDVVKRIIEINQREFENLDEFNEDKLISEDSIRKRVDKLYKSFLDEANILSKFPIDCFKNNDDFFIKLFLKIEDCNDREIISKINKKNLNVDLFKLAFNFDNDLYRLKDHEKNILKNSIRKIIRKCFYLDECIEQVSVTLNYIDDLDVFINVAFDAIIQLTIYRIYAIPWGLEKKKNVTDDILKYQEQILNELSKYIDNSVNLDCKIDEAFDNFLNGIMFSVKEECYCEILSSMICEMEEYKEKYEDVKLEYKYSKEDLVSEEDDLKDILCEGKNIKTYDFNKKLEETKEIIRIFNTYGFRNCNELSKKDLKVYFREIYLDNSKYSIKAKKSISIVREYLELFKLKKVNMKEILNLKEYIFLREKISRGYFREDGCTQEYKLKYKVHINFYKIYFNMYLLFDDHELYIRKSINDGLLRNIFNSIYDNFN